VIKRSFDIAVSAIGLALCSPLFLVVAALIKWDSKGSVFFRQERIGKNFRPFWIYKFRSMVQDAPEKGAMISVTNDPRITWVGGVLRKTKIDELPQLINVLLGDMSLVGPRPEGRRNNAGRCRRLFEERGLSKYTSVPVDSPGHIYNQFVARFPDRARLQSFLRQKDIETEVYYPVPLHVQECFQGLGYRPGDFPKAETAAREALVLPVYPELTQQQQTYVVDNILEFYR